MLASWHVLSELVAVVVVISRCTYYVHDHAVNLKQMLLVNVR